jgi:hypothetical protein
MTSEEIFDTWAPAGVEWSAWAKPVLFAQWPDTITPSSATATSDGHDYLWLPQASGRTAVIVDLPAVDSVRAGIALARRGYRPVPLYNTSYGPSPVIEIAPLILELARGALTLQTTTLPANAPPAFLLDANRMQPPVPPSPGKFDNRWVVFPQDFPSATLLKARGVAEVLILHGGGSSVQEDLAHVLLRWQQAGIRVVAAAPTDTAMRDITVKPPSWFRRAWYRMITVARLKRNNAGGFGAVIPVRTGGHYGYG